MQSACSPRGVFEVEIAQGSGADVGHLVAIKAGDLVCLLFTEEVAPVIDAGGVGRYGAVNDASKSAEISGRDSGERHGSCRGDIERRAVIRCSIDIYFSQFVICIVSDSSDKSAVASNVLHVDDQTIGGITSDGEGLVGARTVTGVSANLGGVAGILQVVEVRRHGAVCGIKIGCCIAGAISIKEKIFCNSTRLGCDDLSSVARG